MASSPARWRRRSARPRSVLIIRAMSAAWRSAARQKMCSRSPPAWAPDAGAAPVLSRRRPPRGFAELVRFGKAYGAKPETMMGLSGLGDLLLTCSSPQSRNFTFGIKLGRGERPDSIHAGLAEGVFTAPVLLEMARDRAIDMPI